MGYYSDASLELKQANAENERLTAEVARLQAIIDELTSPAMDGYYAAAAKLRADNARLQAILSRIRDSGTLHEGRAGTDTAILIPYGAWKEAAEAARDKP
jgi:hypothetical protein